MEESASLEEPLLTSDHINNMANDDDDLVHEGWCQETANHATLYTPAEWNVSSSTCTIRYDAERNLLMVVSSEENQVMDVVDASDIIGAELELCFFGDETEEDPSSRRVGFRNLKAKAIQDAMSVQNGNNKNNNNDNTGGGGACDVFGALRQDLDRVFTWNRSCETDETVEDWHATAYLHIYVYPRRRPTQEGWLSWCGLASHKQIRNPTPPPPLEDENLLGHRYPHHRRFEVVPCQDFYDVGRVVKGIRYVAELGQFRQNLQDNNREKTKKYLVIVNPVSGRKKGREQYESIIKPMLDQACVNHDVFFTAHQHHARERIAHAQQDDVKEFDAVIAVGGDGILNEIINGIQARTDADEVFQRVGIGIIACGTSNGLAKSLLHECKETYGVLESTFLICKGQTRKMDLSTYQVQDKQYTSFLTFSWAYIADIDIESECIRYCGILRNDIWGAWRIAKMRQYRAKFSYLPSCEVGESSSFEMPALTDPVPSHWKTIEDDFVVFWAAQVSHAASNAHNSPMSKIQDGVFQVLVVRAPISRLKLAGIALGFETASHVHSSATEFYECVAYRLEPMTPGSFNDLDGEVIESGPIQARVVPAAMNVFCGNPTSNTTPSE